MLDVEIEINVDGWNLMVFGVKTWRYKLGFFAKFLTLAVWYVWPTITDRLLAGSWQDLIFLIVLTGS
jgi:hypothetical protein